MKKRIVIYNHLEILFAIEIISPDVGEYGYDNKAMRIIRVVPDIVEPAPYPISGIHEYSIAQVHAGCGKIVATTSTVLYDLPRIPKGIIEQFSKGKISFRVDLREKKDLMKFRGSTPEYELVEDSEEKLLVEEEYVYKALYCPGVYESAYCTLSIHRTKEGAEKALELHKKEIYDEYKGYMKQHAQSFKKFADDKDWSVKSTKLEE